MSARSCWYCCGADERVVAFAYVEDGRPALDAHPGCVRHAGHAEALRPMEEGNGDDR